MEEQTFLKLWAITVLAILGAIVLYSGIDGHLFSVIIAVIAGLAGYEIASQMNLRKK